MKNTKNTKPILMDFPDSFETERLLIRTPLPGDGPELYAAVTESLEELRPWMAWASDHGTVADSEESSRRGRVEFLERSNLRMHIFLKGTETLIGSSGLHRIDWDVPRFEIGYWLRTAHTGRGYMTEAVLGITDFAIRELGAKRVEIKCESANEKSAKVAERCGYTLESETRNDARSVSGELRNTLVYAMIPEDQNSSTPDATREASHLH